MLENFGFAINGVIAVVVVLGACVFFHELGHFTLAKLVGMHVHEFAMGFGRRILGFRRGETEYRINLIPLGGYVRIAGMEPGAEPDPRGFYAFPRWQGATVLVAGSLMNVVLAAVAFIAIAVASGIPVFPNTEVVVRRVMSESPAANAGLQPGDQIVSIDGMQHGLLIESVESGGIADGAGLQEYDRFYLVAGEQVNTAPELLAQLAAPPAADGETADGAVEAEVLRLTPEGSLVDTVTVELARLEEVPDAVAPGDAGELLERELGISLFPMGMDEALSYITRRPDESLAMVVLRDGQSLELDVVPAREWARVAQQDESGRLSSAHQEVGRIGVVLEAQTREVGFAEAIHHGIQGSIDAVIMVAGGLYMMVTGQIAPEASGPIGIAALTADSARVGWTAVARIGGIISANLAIINLFPFPPFDGFRIVLLGIEGVMRRRVNQRIETIVTITGVAILLGLFLIITFRDILNLVLFRTP
ncbi:MAG: PDZ domain-containing protein [candidate division WS1 bacterium]|jgi:regulator of sigma E protease|nr:PDZ domain-containing protein [candidate division WS1 bacterium]